MATAADLLPWLHVLKNYVDLPCRPTPDAVDEALETGVVWLRWQGHQEARDEEAMAYEAIELLALLACVDYDEWLRAVAVVWPRATAFWEDRLLPRPFELGVEVFAEQEGELSAWAARPWAAGAAHFPLDDDYNNVCDGLETEVRRLGKTTTDIRVRFVLGERIGHR